MIKLIDSYPNVAAEWHPTKNVKYSLDKISHGSHKKVWWLGKCGHEWESRVDQRTCSKAGCPKCNNNRKDQPLSETHPHLVLEWHPRNKIKPDRITAGRHLKVWWLGKCGHEWEAYVHNRSKPNKPSACPFCSNRSTDNSNSLQFKNPDIAKEWHPTYNVGVTANKINYRSYTRVWWLAECGHEWKSMVRIRTRKIRPAGCPICQESKGELRIKKYLEKVGVEFESQFRFESCRDKKPLPFDFRVGQLLIEYQGIQHFEAVNFGGDYLKTFNDLKRHDEIKRDWTAQNNYELLEISYKDFEQIEKILEDKVFNK